MKSSSPSWDTLPQRKALKHSLQVILTANKLIHEKAKSVFEITQTACCVLIIACFHATTLGSMLFLVKTNKDVIFHALI